MKSLKVLLGFLLGITYLANGQNIHFLNKSICNPTNLNLLDEANEYVQGGGHNMYLSYTLDEQVGSFSKTEYAYGTEENPMIILVDTVNGKAEKKYLKKPVGELYAGMRGDDMWISEDLWEGYSDEKDPMIGSNLPYESNAFQCAVKDRKESDINEDIEQSASTNFDRKVSN